VDQFSNQLEIRTKGVQEETKKTFLKKKSEILMLITSMVEAIMSLKTLKLDTMKKTANTRIKEKNSWTSISWLKLSKTWTKSKN